MMLAKACPEEAQQYLERCMNMFRSNMDELRAISSTAYNLAGGCYRNGEYQTALGLFESSSTAAMWCHDLAADDESCLLVVKRLDALATCKMSMSDQEVCFLLYGF